LHPVRCSGKKIMLATILLHHWKCECFPFVIIARGDAAFIADGKSTKTATPRGVTPIYSYFDINSAKRLLYPPASFSMKPSDDDDVSQHEYTVYTDGEDLTKSENKPALQKYRRVEEWHDEHMNENPRGEQVLAHLKREQAKWASKFESLGGEGI